MTKAAKALTPEEALQQIHSHVTAYLSGGPDREAEDIVLAQQVGLDVKPVVGRWVEARDYLLFICPPPQPKRAEPPKHTEPKTADSGVKSTASWRRDGARAAQPVKQEAVAAKLGPIASALLDRPPKDTRMPKAPPLPPREAPLAPPNAGIDRLTYPRGLLGHVTQYVEDTAALPNRWLSMSTALASLAKGLDRKILGPTGNSVILWTLLVAEFLTASECCSEQWALSEQ
jgi:hypothetical protein